MDFIFIRLLYAFVHFLLLCLQYFNFENILLLKIIVSQNLTLLIPFCLEKAINSIHQFYENFLLGYFLV